jgi:hypothetical protein
MCGRLTFTTEVSSTSMTALDMTAMAINQRPACGWLGPALIIGVQMETRVIPAHAVRHGGRPL